MFIKKIKTLIRERQEYKYWMKEWNDAIDAMKKVDTNSESYSEASKHSDVCADKIMDILGIKKRK